ncbi:MAG: hypothetical protein R3Y12_05455 [Clostridia bacterium]
MSDIDFQNGFICGMATRGLVKSGQSYEPLVWCDVGNYDYFYIDFYKAVSPFTLTMLTSSIVVRTLSNKEIIRFEKISNSVFKIYCDISDGSRGVIMTNHSQSYLNFTSGIRVYAFVITFYPTGMEYNTDLAYVFDDVNYTNVNQELLKDVENVDFKIRQNSKYNFMDKTTYASTNNLKGTDNVTIELFSI